MTSKLFRTASVAAAFVGMSLPLAAQNVPEPFRADVLVDGLLQPKGLDMAHYMAGGGSMGDYLFVAESGANQIIEIDTRTGLYEPLSPTAPFPVGVACYGGPFSSYMYVGCAFSGGIERISAGGVSEPFGLLGMSIAGLDFGKGQFGQYLYAGEWAAGNVWRVDTEGNATLFATVPGGETRYLKFSEGGDFGHYLYFTDFIGGDVWRVNAQGETSLFASVGTTCLEGLAFGPGGAFGKDLYVGDLCAGEIYRIAPDGTVVLWADGFDGVADIKFAPGGKGGFVMYFVDGNSRVYSIAHEKNKKVGL